VLESSLNASGVHSLLTSKYGHCKVSEAVLIGLALSSGCIVGDGHIRGDDWRTRGSNCAGH